MTGGRSSQQAVLWRRRERGDKRELVVTAAVAKPGLVGSQREFTEGLMGAPQVQGFPSLSEVQALFFGALKPPSWEADGNTSRARRIEYFSCLEFT